MLLFLGSFQSPFWGVVGGILWVLLAQPPGYLPLIMLRGFLLLYQLLGSRTAFLYALLKSPLAPWQLTGCFIISLWINPLLQVLLNPLSSQIFPKVCTTPNAYLGVCKNSSPPFFFVSQCPRHSTSGSVNWGFDLETFNPLSPKKFNNVIVAFLTSLSAGPATSKPSTHWGSLALWTKPAEQLLKSSIKQARWVHKPLRQGGSPEPPPPAGSRIPPPRSETIPAFLYQSTSPKGTSQVYHTTPGIWGGEMPPSKVHGLGDRGGQHPSYYLL